MVFDKEQRTCVFPDCRSPTAEELDKCGSFDCTDESVRFCLGSGKFSGPNRNRFSRCVLDSGKSSVRVCSFECGTFEENGETRQKIFSSSNQECIDECKMKVDE